MSRQLGTRPGYLESPSTEGGRAVYEHRRDRLLPFRTFLGRVVRHLGLSAVLILGSLFIGMLGYVRLEGLGWLDGFLNAAMLLGGMGPVAPLQTPGGKLFAGLYALYAGMVFLVAVGIALAPVLHRVMHKFHLAEEPTEPNDASEEGTSPLSGARGAGDEAP
jgi:hypothetical protein